MTDPFEPIDDVLAALDGLSEALEQSAADHRTMAMRVRHLDQSRRVGKPWRQILDSEPDPGLIPLSSRVLGRLSTSSAEVRRRLASSLRAEGVPIYQIARLFGVSHQRVSNLLARRGDGPASE